MLSDAVQQELSQVPELFNLKLEPHVNLMFDACESLTPSWTSTAPPMDARDANIKCRAGPGIGPTPKNVVSVCTLK